MTPSKIEEILEKVLFAHHDDISESDDNNIAEAAIAIQEYYLSLVPEPITIDDALAGDTLTDLDQIAGHNSCRDLMVRKIKEGE